MKWPISGIIGVPFPYPVPGDNTVPQAPEKGPSVLGTQGTPTFQAQVTCWRSTGACQPAGAPEQVPISLSSRRWSRPCFGAPGSSTYIPLGKCPALRCQQLRLRSALVWSRMGTATPFTPKQPKGLPQRLGPRSPGPQTPLWVCNSP